MSLGSAARTPQRAGEQLAKRAFAKPPLDHQRRRERRQLESRPTHGGVHGIEACIERCPSIDGFEGHVAGAEHAADESTQDLRDRIVHQHEGLVHAAVVPRCAAPFKQELSRRGLLDVRVDHEHDR